MDPKDKDLLERTFEYARENNKILRSMRRSLRLNSFLRIIYWIIIIVVAIWLYYYLEPIISDLIESFGGLENLQNLIKSDAVSSQQGN